MNIVLFSSERFPNVGAQGNRQLSYSRGLVELGHKVTIYTIASKDKNMSSQFVIDGIKIVYLFDWKKGLGKPGSLYNLFCINIILLLTIFRSRKTADVLIYNLYSTIWINPLCKLLLARVLKLTVVVDLSEYPLYIRSQKLSDYKRRESKVLTRQVAKLYSGLFIMTEALISFYKQNSNLPICHLPMTVDLNRFENREKCENQYGTYYAYCGNLKGDKDGVPILLAAFKEFRRVYKSDIKLLLIGPCKDINDKQYIDKYIEEANGDIIWLGELPPDEIPQLLMDARALLLARPNNKQAEGGFPTKLGEYLATGNPVVVTAVGENPAYLKDGISAYIAAPDKADAFVTKLIEMESNWKQAEEVGKRGKEVACKYFNYRKQAQTMIEFIISLKK